PAHFRAYAHIDVLAATLGARGVVGVRLEYWYLALLHSRPHYRHRARSARPRIGACYIRFSRRCPSPHIGGLAATTLAAEFLRSRSRYMGFRCRPAVRGEDRRSRSVRRRCCLGLADAPGQAAVDETSRAGRSPTNERRSLERGVANFTRKAQR